MNAAQRLSRQLIAFAVSFPAESKVRCWRIQISRSATIGADFSPRTSRCSGVLPLMARSISKRISMRRTASLAIGASPDFARSKNFRWWIRAAKRPVIANIGPDPAGNRLKLGKHRHRRIVIVDAFGPHNMGLDRFNNGIERHPAGADPIRQGRDIDLDPFAGVGLALPVQRLMQQELVDQHHRQQARPGKASRAPAPQ